VVSLGAGGGGGVLLVRSATGSSTSVSLGAGGDGGVLLVRSATGSSSSVGLGADGWRLPLGGVGGWRFFKLACAELGCGRCCKLVLGRGRFDNLGSDEAKR